MRAAQILLLCSTSPASLAGVPCNTAAAFGRSFNLDPVERFVGTIRDPDCLFVLEPPAEEISGVWIDEWSDIEPRQFGGPVGGSMTPWWRW